MSEFTVRQSGRVARFALLLIAAFAGGYAANRSSQATAHAQSVTPIRATEYILTDQQGRTAGRLRTGRSGAELILNSANDSAQVQIGAGSGIVIRDKSGRITWSSPSAGVVPASE